MDDGSATTLTRFSPHLVDSGLAPEEDQRSSMIDGQVLVAVDLSADSRAALLWACEHAANANASLTVLHVLHDPAEDPGKYVNASDPLTPMADTAGKMLSEFIAAMRADHPRLERLAEAQTKLMSGLPARTIIQQAERLEASLIVMGSRGQTGLPELLNGSTAKRVVQLSPIPVTVVKAPR